MALTDPIDTLAYHQSRALTSNIRMSHVACARVAHQLKQFQDHDTQGDTKPEREALCFYGMNHGMSLIKSTYAALEPMRDDDLAFVKTYYSCLAPMAARAFYYLLIICTREARHSQSLSLDLPTIKTKFGEPMHKFFQSVMGGGEDGIHKHLMNFPPDTNIGAYVECLRWMFYNSSWGGGFGGEAWGAVTDCLVRFVTGEFTAEMMLDTNWTLAHNNGPIFNKGFFYGLYSGNLYRVLDVQRSGQVPEMILFDPQIKTYVYPHLHNLMDWVKTRFQNTIGDYVDWYVVETLGSVHKYPNDKKQQVANHGDSPSVQKLAKMLLKKEQDAKLQAEKVKLEYLKNHYTVLPGLDLKKIKMKRTAA